MIRKSAFSQLHTLPEWTPRRRLQACTESEIDGLSTTVAICGWGKGKRCFRDATVICYYCAHGHDQCLPLFFLSLNCTQQAYCANNSKMFTNGARGGTEVSSPNTSVRVVILY